MKPLYFKIYILISTIICFIVFKSVVDVVYNIEKRIDVLEQKVGKIGIQEYFTDKYYPLPPCEDCEIRELNNNKNDKLII